jgi:type II secretory pathway pseudopilin PulG
MRLSALGALALGYLLGARAGRERYEEIRQLAGQAAQRLESYGSSGSLATWVADGHHRDGTRT